MKNLILKNDKYRMNWIEGNTEWGTVKAPDGIAVRVSSERNGDIVNESYTFTNTTDKDIFTSRRDISIYTPFNDDYKSSDECITNRCHTHIWCGGNVSWIMALRMGGDAPHLGLVLTEGSLCGYSTERDLDKMSNDRGDFILHPSPIHLAPQESFTIAWTLFPYDSSRDFFAKLPKYCGNYIEVRAQNYIVFKNEPIQIRVVPCFDFDTGDVSIVRAGKNVPFSLSENSVTIEENPQNFGEYIYDIKIKGVKTLCRVLSMPDINTLALKRCEFIVKNQQCSDSAGKLNGAYLIYDNEENHVYYSGLNDYNGGRERIGMGLLITKFLQHTPNETLDASLKRYTEYVKRELLDEHTGTVFNDCGRDDSYKRLYNYPWMSLFFLEMYLLRGDSDCLRTAYKILVSFYKQGGAHFYAIEVPIERISSALKAAHMTDELNELSAYFEQHCDFIIKCGTCYPAHEVNYEQSIVAPAANILLQMYKVTGKSKYSEAAQRQIEVLELFNGLQPDYHLYETAIRHWDCYWFGKNRLYGDTFPHYWSALTANAYKTYGEITGKDEYIKKADAAYRSVLSLIRPDGSASCAYVYPISVNHEKGEYYDAYANDQDWGLYFMLRYLWS